MYSVRSITVRSAMSYLHNNRLFDSNSKSIDHHMVSQKTFVKGQSHCAWTNNATCIIRINQKSPRLISKLEVCVAFIQDKNFKHTLQADLLYICFMNRAKLIGS